MTGQAEDAKCRFVDKVVDFGTLAVGLPQERTVRLKSEGKDPAVFSVQQIPGSGVTVVLSKGIIGAGESVVLKIFYATLSMPLIPNCWLMSAMAAW